MKKLCSAGFRLYLPSFFLVGAAFILVISGWFLFQGYQQSQLDYDWMAQLEYNSKIKDLEVTVSSFFKEHPDTDELLREEIRESLQKEELEEKYLHYFSESGV